jgi:hypothetical protein
VRLRGPLFERLAGDFSRHFDVSVGGAPGRPGLGDPGTFDLTCLDARAAGSRAGVRHDLRDESRRLLPGGAMVLATRDPFTLESARRAGAGALRYPPIPVVRRLLRGAGLTGIDQLLALPDHDEAEDLWSSDLRDFEAPAYGSPLERAVRALGLERWIHGDVLLLASAQGPSPLEALRRECVTALGTIGVPAGAHWRLERVSARPRGALILVADDADATGHVLRVATSDRVAARLRLNADRTAAIHSRAELSGRWSDAIPRGLGSVRVRGHWCHVERRVRGVLAWKLAPDSAAAAQATRDAQEFLEALAAATAEDGPMSETRFEALVGTDLRELAVRFAAEPDAAPLVGRIHERLRAALLGKAVRTVLGHGDFGFGNLLVERRTGAVRGVIDWDTSLEVELPGVDRANLRLQLGSRTRSGDTARALMDLFDDITADGLAVAMAGLRMVLRTLPYAVEFEAMRPANVALLRVIDERAAAWARL